MGSSSVRPVPGPPPRGAQGLPRTRSGSTVASARRVGRAAPPARPPMLRACPYAVGRARALAPRARVSAQARW